MRPAFAQLQRVATNGTSRLATQLFTVVFFALSMCATFARAESPTMRLRVAWGDGPSAAWRGTIAVDRGTITEITPLGVEADEPGSMWLEAGQAHVQQRSARTYDGLDLTLAAPLDASLTISLQSNDAVPLETIELKLSSLISQHQERSLDEAGTRLFVRRTPGDRLRVELANPSLVMSPGEQLMFQLTPVLFGPNVTGQVDLRTEVRSARDDRVWSKTSQTIDAPPADGAGQAIPITALAPEQEGAYDIVLTASQPKPRRGFAQVNPLAGNTNIIAERRIQFVVLADQAPEIHQDATEPVTVVDEIKAGRQWWNRVPKLGQIPGLNRPLPGLQDNPLKNGNVQPWMHPQLGELTAIDASPADADLNWVAYSLDVKQPGQVHVLEVEYPADVPQQLGVSVIEPNGAGSVGPVSLDSGVHVPRHGAKEGSRLGVHRLIFWPRTDSPVVLLTNQSQKTQAAHGRIRVLGPKQIEVGGLRLGGSARSYLPKAELARPAPNGRMLAAYLQRPFLPESFSASEAYDSWSGRSLDDWLTFYQSGQRAIGYLQHVGYNTLVVSAFADGSTIYPSDLLEPTPQYDTGAFFATGQDPVRKDVLEMLFRMCDRAGVRLIPAVDFSSPLPALEAALRRGEGEGVRLIGSRGLPWAAEHGGASRANGDNSTRHDAVQYNPMNRQVQEAMLGVVQEIVQRYRHHPSFAGLMIGSSDNSYALLPGDEWGLDDHTIGRFSRDTGIQVPGEGESRFTERANFVRGQHRESWLTWRAKQVQALLTDMRRNVQEIGPDARLFVSAERLYNSPEIERAVRPTLPGQATGQQLPLSIGLDPGSYHNDPHIVLLRPRSIAPVPTASEDAVRRQLNDSEHLEASFANAGSLGSLFLHKPLRKRLASFDQVSPFGSDKTYVSLATQLMPSSADNRRRFVRALAARDEHLFVEGGRTLPLGQESSLRDVFRVYRQLPAVPFETIPTGVQPLVLRVATHKDATYVYVVNDSAWPAEVQLNVHGPLNTTVEDLRAGAQEPGVSQGRLTVSLAPYDLVAYRLGAQNVTVDVAAAAVDEEAQVELAERIDELVARATALSNPEPIGVVENPGFEMAAPRDDIPGWQFSGGVGSQAKIDSGQSQGGRQSVRLSSSGQLALLVSKPFPSPVTGRLAFSVWLRIDPSQPLPPLRLAVGGEQANGQDYYRFGRIAGLNRFEDAGWQHIQFQVDDLPLADRGQLQIRFDLMGAGTVWIDDVEATTLHFSETEKTHLTRLITKAHLQLNDGRISDCSRVLEGYWPRFLEDHVPLPEARVAEVAEEPVEPAAEAPGKEPAPKQSWWKRGLPSILK